MRQTVVLLNALPDKKIKSLGNKCLLKITKNTNFFDYHIKIINSIFKKPEIIVVGGFDSKKLKKYIDIKYKNIKYIDHEITNVTNIGTSIKKSIDLITTKKCFIINSSIILNKYTYDALQKNFNNSFIITSDHNADVGCLIDSNNKCLNCYYDLPKNSPLDIINISERDFDMFRNLCSQNIDKLFFFEIINMCIANNLNIQSIKINKKGFSIIDNINSINKIREKKYV